MSRLMNTVALRVFDTGSFQPDPATSAARVGTQSIETRDVMLKRSKDSAAMLEYWDLTDTIVDGIDAVRLAGEKYLPKFVSEESTDYAYRRSMTKMTNIYRDTVEGLANKPFEQDVTFVVDEANPVPQVLTDFIEDVDGAGSNLTAFASATFFNGINSAIDWIFVDHSEADPTIRTVADAKRVGLRPYWSHVLGRNVLEARQKVIAGKETLTYVRIFEPGVPDRVRIFERAENGTVTWELRAKGATWVAAPGGGETMYAVEKDGTLTIPMIPLVPFYTGRRDGRTFRFFPAMRDAADLQVDLYQQESGLKYAKTLTAYPMLAANGIAPPVDAANKPIKLAVGPGRVLYSKPNGSGQAGSWGYVEPNAASLKFLADDIKATQEQLRELGRQPLTAQSGNLTVITTAVAASKAKSAVSAWAGTLKNALENAAVITCAWLNIAPSDYDPTMFVYDDFDNFTEGKDLEDLNTMRENGDLSQETYWEEKKRRGVLSPEFDRDTELERILTETPGDGVDTGLDDDPDPDDKPDTP